MARKKIVAPGRGRPGKSADLTQEEMKAAVDAYRAAGGNKSEAARRCGLDRGTYQHRLKLAQKHLGIKLGKVVDGRVTTPRASRRPLPAPGETARYILTSAQNNTHPHKAGLACLIQYRDWLSSLGSCELIIGTFSYNIDAYGAKATKRGTRSKTGGGSDLWYAPELEPYFVDKPVELAPALIWCGEMNILPTASTPLVGMDDYNGRASNIVPHAKHSMLSVASLADEATKLNYTTGCITLRNYIQKRVGIIAEQKHDYGAVIVEVDSDGNWYVRQLAIDDNGCMYDIGPDGFRGVRVSPTGVESLPADASPDLTFTEAVAWGDIHAAEMDYEVRQLGWANGGMLDTLAPRRQIMHDVFSMRSRGHHEMKDFHAMYRKYVNKEDSVRGEMQVTADFLSEAARPWCESVVVRSNHCRHLDRWLNEAKPNADPVNARYFMHLQSQYLEAIDEGDEDFNILAFALREAGAPESIRFLGEDESFIICRKSPTGGGIECGLHGDLGPNGSRGSTRALRKLGRRVIKNHDHTAAIIDGVYSGGACSLNFPYMKGPNAHSVSHVVAFENGARQIVTFWGGKYRA